MRGSGLGVVLLLAMAMLAATRTSSAAELAAEAQVVPLDDASVIQLINRELRKIWEQDQLRPSPRATDAEWCRRVFIDLIGRVPTVAELNTFLALPGDRRTKLVDLLLSDVYQTEYAQHWGTIYSNLLIGRPYTAKSRASTPLADRAAFQSYLARCFAENKPYDRLVTELVTATGSTSPGADDFNPATNYLVDLLQNDAIEATAKSARHFLAMRMQCLQCHNDPQMAWRHEVFWSYNAFFRQACVSPPPPPRFLKKPTTPSARIFDADFKSNVADPNHAEIYYEVWNGTQAVAYPKFIDGTKVDANGSITKVNRRVELAKLLVKHHRFGIAVANRMWAHLLGYGLSKDPREIEERELDSGLYAQLIHAIGTQFMANGHNLRRLMRWITLSEPYQLSSKVSPAQQNDAPDVMGRRRFSHFHVRMIEPELVLEAINTVRTQNDAKAIDWRQSGGPHNEVFAEFMQSLENDNDALMSQPQEAANQQPPRSKGLHTKPCLRRDEIAILGKLKLSGKQNREIVDFLFLATYGRKPSAKELQQLGQAVRSERVDEVHQDLLWSLINSNEFLFVY